MHAIQLDLSERIVCSMYNFYLNMVALESLTSSQQNRTNFTSSRILAEGVMASAYLWVCVCEDPIA